LPEVRIYFSFKDEPAKLSYVSMARFYVSGFIIRGFIISVSRVPFFRLSLSRCFLFSGFHFSLRIVAAASAGIFSSFKNISRGFFDFWSDWLLLHEKKAIIL